MSKELAILITELKGIRKTIMKDVKLLEELIFKIEDYNDDNENSEA